MKVPRSYRLPFSLMRAWNFPERVLLTPLGKPERGLGLTGPPCVRESTGSTELGRRLAMAEGCQRLHHGRWISVDKLVVRFALWVQSHGGYVRDATLLIELSPPAAPRCALGSIQALERFC